MKIKLFGLMFISAIAIVGGFARAVNVYGTDTSVRALGMGDAHLGVVTNIYSLFYNPAGLARSGLFSWRILDVRLGLTGTEAYQDLQDLQGSATFETAIKNLYGENVWMGGGALTGVTVPFSAFAIYDSLDASLLINNPVYPNLDINAINDFGYALGVGLPILPGFHAGIVIKRIKRTGSRLPFGPSFIASLDPDAIRANVERTGVGYGMDLGVNVITPGPIEVVLSGVWKNVGRTTFRNDGGISLPPFEENQIDVGLAMNIDAALVHITPSVDFKYLNREDVHLGKKINFGVELGLPILDIRGGFHQGYYTAGAGVNLGIIQVDAATYGVELGEYPGQLEDRRYVIECTLELGFDFGSFAGGSSKGGSGKGGGGLGSSGGGRKSGIFGGGRLKQRR